MKTLIAAFISISLLVPALHSQEAQVQPIRACAVLHDLAAYDGKILAIVGRYSFRQTGRTLGEEECEKRAQPSTVRIVFDRATAPKTPDRLEISAGTVQSILKTIQQRTALAKFRFGTADYDRWAVAYGRLEVRKGPGKDAWAQLVCAGDSEIMFVVDRH